VDQTEHHPYQSAVSAAIEGCGENAQGTVSLGFINQFPANDEMPSQDESCVENNGSFDPNDKQGLPLGTTDAHYIKKNQPLEYLIRFQNTGTDTAFTVIVLDTLSTQLDVSTFRLLGTSHTCQTVIHNNRVLQFVFDNILLPDSNVNEAASHGFIRFSMAPVANIAELEVIENDAAIYFDFNEPVITNRTRHTIEQTVVSVQQWQATMADIDVFPNPSTGNSTLLIQGAVPGTYRTQLLDMQGRLIHQQKFDGTGCELRLQALPAGNYQLRIEQAGNFVGTVRLSIVKE
jgi:uncharacterized repeat protein (TIGR01451 family)